VRKRRDEGVFRVDDLEDFSGEIFGFFEIGLKSLPKTILEVVFIKIAYKEISKSQK